MKLLDFTQPNLNLTWPLKTVSKKKRKKKEEDKWEKKKLNGGCCFVMTRIVRWRFCLPLTTTDQSNCFPHVNERARDDAFAYARVRQWAG